MSRTKLLFLTYLPWAIAMLFQYNAVLSYIFAWLGSFFIFYLTLLSPFRYYSLDRPIRHQVMRPIVLIQLVFAGFMCCSSVFYFARHLGFQYLENISYHRFNASRHTELIAQCQRIALLAHAALVTGMILMIKPAPQIQIYLLKPSKYFLFKFCITSFILGNLLNYTPGLIQFQQPLLSISVSCSAYILLKGIVLKNLIHLIFGNLTFGFQILNATLTGYKESIIINVILTIAMIFPYYKKQVLLISIPAIFLLLYALPTFTIVIRSQSWQAGKPSEVAREEAYHTLLNNENIQKINDTNWEFLTNRCSEIGMFTQYIRKVPEQHPYYGWEILINSFYALFPRLIWKDKPNTEQVAMKRVYQLGVVNTSSSVSAKTRPVVDAYLSGGTIVVFVAMLTYGLLSQYLSNMTERLFGGYSLGCIIVFNSLFQQLWRGNTLEFLLNNILYGCILMIIIHYFMKKTNILTYETNTYHTFL